MKLVLASASPRRKEILQNCGFDFTVRVKEVDENIYVELSPCQYVTELAKRKASVADCNEDEVVICADSVVVFDGKIMGKPQNEDEAYLMLKSLSGNTHSVFTGVCLKALDKTTCFYCETKVVFYELSDKQILDYIKTNEPMDKAGAYGIQSRGALFVKEIQGDYFNVVGLPVSMLNIELEKFT